MLGYVLLAQKCVQSSIPYEITVENWRRVKLGDERRIGELGLVCVVQCMQQASKLWHRRSRPPLFPVVFLA